MMGGWIKIYQTIREHWIWERPRYLKWWLDLLMLACLLYTSDAADD